MKERGQISLSIHQLNEVLGGVKEREGGGELVHDGRRRESEVVARSVGVASSSKGKKALFRRRDGSIDRIEHTHTLQHWCRATQPQQPQQQQQRGL